MENLIVFGVDQRGEGETEKKMMQTEVETAK